MTYGYRMINIKPVNLMASCCTDLLNNVYQVWTESSEYFMIYLKRQHATQGQSIYMTNDTCFRLERLGVMHTKSY